jgi:hypothetical protein
MAEQPNSRVRLGATSRLELLLLFVPRAAKNIRNNDRDAIQKAVQRSPINNCKSSEEARRHLEEKQWEPPPCVLARSPAALCKVLLLDGGAPVYEVWSRYIGEKPSPCNALWRCS